MIKLKEVTAVTAVWFLPNFDNFDFSGYLMKQKHHMGM